MNDALIGFIGVLAGSGLSLIGTIIALRHERKLSSESDLRKFDYSTKEWLRNEKVLLYVEFARILEKIDVYHTTGLGPYTIEKEDFKTYSDLIEKCVDDNSGKIAFFFPPDINLEVVRFRVEVIGEFIINKDSDKITEERVETITKSIKRIIDMMKNDIGIINSK